MLLAFFHYRDGVLKYILVIVAVVVCVSPLATSRGRECKLAGYKISAVLFAAARNICTMVFYPDPPASFNHFVS